MRWRTQWPGAARNGKRLLQERSAEEAVITTAQQSGPQAFTAAVAARDVDALVDALAPDAVLHSPLIRAPFEGREVVVDLYLSLFESFEELRIVEELSSDGDAHAFFWEGRIRGRPVEGADRLRTNAEGKVREITVMARPLVGAMGFLTDMGFHFARRRRGPVVAAVLRLTALPLAPLFALLDPVTRWLQRGRA